MTKLLGIDVSEHNGKINWDAMKRNGIKFAVIRSSYGHFVEDQQFRRNVNECDRVGMPYGLYHYSYVATQEQMKAEASGFIRLCKSCKPSYPCFIDMEDSDGWKKQMGVSDEMNIKVCYYTCSELEANGFYAGIYANLDWWVNHLNSTSLDRFDKWVAQWASVNTYTKPYQMWQFTSDGHVDGHEGRLDMDYSYVDYPKLIISLGLNGHHKDDGSHNGNSGSGSTQRPKYSVGDKIAFKGLWTQSNGGNWYPVDRLAVKSGVITKILYGTQHPYLINYNVGWANDSVVIEKESQQFKIGDKVRFDGLWTQSNGDVYYPVSSLLVKSGTITDVIKGAKHPYLINHNVGWAQENQLHHQ